MKTFRAFLRLAVPFWIGGAHPRPWLLLAAMVACSLGFVRVSVAINAWNKEFYDALAAFDAGAIPGLAAAYAVYLTLAVVAIAAGNWFLKRLAFDWRDWATDDLQRRWLEGHAHYRLRFGDEPDNPDQRIAEDIALLAERTLELFRSFLVNVTRLGAFVAILWSISGTQTLTIAGTDFRIDGYLVWIAAGYSAFSTLVMHAVGHRLLALKIDQQAREADYRTALIGVRGWSEQIAFHRGEAAELVRLSCRFDDIRRNWHALIGREFRIECFSAAQMRVAWFIPIVAILPLYLQRTITLGDMMQAQNAFSSVLDGFSWVLTYYRRIMEWAAVVRRLQQLNDALERTGLPSRAAGHGTGAGDGGGGGGGTVDRPFAVRPVLCIDGVDIVSPAGRPLLSAVTARFEAPAHVRIDGPSGCGKSTLLRALAGLHPCRNGRLSVGTDAMFLPQHSYLPNDSLRAVVSYPSERPFDDRTIAWALGRVGLARLSAELDRHAEWSTLLSGGERQRLGFAQLLLHRPGTVVMDEATSQLDEESSIAMYRLLRDTLPDSLVIAVTHQLGLAMLFDRSIDLRPFLVEACGMGEPMPRPLGG